MPVVTKDSFKPEGGEKTDSSYMQLNLKEVNENSEILYTKEVEINDNDIE